MTLSRNESYQKNNYKKFTNFTSIYNMRLGLKKVNCISLLPTKVEALYYSLMIWIFRVIGGICLAKIITRKYAIFYKELHIIILIAATIQSILIISISLIKGFYGLYFMIKNLMFL
uniref:hypothetical protein n=1 Tax=Trametes gibbosa TaxID=160864 RepID=UPI0030037D3F|nr:hypothetical protein [Trametes gibbosa]